MRKKLLTIFAGLFCVILLCACDSKVDCVYVDDGRYIHYYYYVTLSNEAVTEIENSATSEGRQDGQKWTLYDYFKALAKECNWLISVDENEKESKFSFYARIEKNTSENGSTAEKKVDKGFFFTTTSYVQPHPMITSVNSYADDTAKERTLSYVIKHGKDSCPALVSAFPIAENALDKLTMSFYWRNDNAEAINGDEVYIDGERYLRFTVKANESEQTISYSYTVVNPVGWYVVIGSVGILAVALTLLLTRKARKKPKLVSEKKPPIGGAKVYYNQPLEDIFGIDEKKDDKLEDIFGIDEDKKD